MKLIVVATLCACLGAAADARADHGKIDHLELSNGDRLTCEVRGLDRGKLTAKVDGMGTVSIEWNRVVRLVSPATYQVELSSGRRLVGSIEAPSAARLSIRSATDAVVVDLLDVVRVAPLEPGFFKSLDGSIDFGFNFAQADSLTQ